MWKYQRLKQKQKAVRRDAVFLRGNMTDLYDGIKGQRADDGNLHHTDMLVTDPVDQCK